MQTLANRLSALLRKHGFADRPLVPLVHRGVVNDVYRSDDLVVRVSKEPDNECDVWTETVAVPALRASGFPTPALLAFDADRDLFPGLVTIYERAAGIPVASRTTAMPETFYRDLGRTLADLHSRVGEAPDPDGLLDAQDFYDAPALLRRAGLPPEETLRWSRWLEKLRSAFAVLPPVVFVHGDLHQENLLADDGGRLAAVLDWGDAGWGDPSRDFVYLPASAIPGTVSAYRQARPEADFGLEGRILFELAGQAFEDLAEGDSSRLRDLRAFLGSGVGSAWRRWFPDEPEAG